MKQYLGLDSSTQGLKAVIIDGRGIIAEESINFGNDLPEYHSPNGFLENEDPEICHGDPLLWAAALDLLFLRMKEKKIDLSRIAGISGSGQQHGSVYLNENFSPILKSLDPQKELAREIAPALARKTSPIWRDHSTAKQCEELIARFGERLQRETGSTAPERFTGPQIRKFAQEEPEAWKQTFHVHLVSSFLCSLLCGKQAPIDYGDGAGMNLLNLKSLEWDPEITDFTAPDLKDKLPPVTNSRTIAGTLSPYFCKYGFSPDIPVTVWSGDNPCSLVGTGCASPGTIGISLGTSDTVFAPMVLFKTDPLGCGHVFGNPAGGFMSLICFANGSLAREEVRRKYQLDWISFDEMCCRTKPGNGGRLMLPYFAPECTPSASAGIVCNYEREACSPAENIRSLLESQALSMRLHSEWIGEKVHRIRLTGGASGLKSFRRIIADVFQADIEIQESSNAAGLGAAMRAANAVEGISFAELTQRYCPASQKIPHDPEAGIVYKSLLEQYRLLEQKKL